MHPLDKAEKILSGQWPKNPKWIYESPDSGKTVYRRMSQWGLKQLISSQGKPVADNNTLDQQYLEEYIRGQHD